MIEHEKTNELRLLTFGENLLTALMLFWVFLRNFMRLLARFFDIHIDKRPFY